MRQLEREKALLQHKSLESHRKAESEADRKRCLENEGVERWNLKSILFVLTHIKEKDTYCSIVCCSDPISLYVKPKSGLQCTSNYIWPERFSVYAK